MNNNLNVSDILELWSEFTNLSEEKNSWVVNSWDYTFHRYNEKIIELSKSYNIPDTILIIYLKNLFIWYLKEANISLFNCFENNIDLSLVKKLYDSFNQDNVKQIEEDFYNNLNYISSKLMNKKLIGNIDFSKIVENSLDIIYDELGKCHLEIYQKGQKINIIESVCTEIFIFNTLVDCLSVLQKQPDAIYICYISNHNTSDGYFGFFIKNNGNIFSMNERVEEAYMGQHSHGRNHRFVENKTDGLFPYQLFEFSNYDYKGYARTYTLKSKEDKNIALTDLEDNSYITLLITIMLLKMRFENEYLDGPIKYSNYYLQNNLNLLHERKDTELMIINNNQIMNNNQQEFSNLINKLTSENVSKGQFNNDFNHSIHPELDYREYGNFDNNIFIDLYGDGFELHPELLMLDNSLKLLSSDNVSKDDVINAEFIGTEKQLSLQLYYEARKQLAKFIEEKMKEEYQKFIAEFKSVENWYHQKIDEHRDRITKILVQEYVTDKYNNDLSSDGWRKVGQNLSVSYTEDNSYGRWYGYDKYNGKPCNCKIKMQLSSWEDIEFILGEEVPKIIKGYEYNRGSGLSSKYYGNPLLDVVDPVVRIQTPFESRGSFCYNSNYYDFSISLYFSKSGLNKYIKDNKIVPEIKEKTEKNTYTCVL